MTGLCYFYLNFYISHVVFMFNIRGVEPVNIRELSVFILRWPIWGCGIFIQVINVWHSTFGTLWLHKGPVLKLLPCLNKTACTLVCPGGE